MKREEIMKNVGSTFRKVGIRFQKHSPEIFIVCRRGRWSDKRSFGLQSDDKSEPYFGEGQRGH